MTSRAGRLSERGRYNWLKDVQAVTPTERVPRWLLSKYFYREMNPLLRYGLLPFLLLFNLSVLLAVLAGLDVAGVWTIPVETADAVLTQLGLVGEAVHFFLVAAVVTVGSLLVVSVPAYLILRDFGHTVERFGVLEGDLTVDPEQPYIEAARDVFAENPETAVFCYGHTHRPTTTEVEGRVLVNTGTWLKRLHRRDVVTGVLPPVFYPSYQLCVVRIATESGSVVVDYEEIAKADPSAEELTLTERVLTLGRAPTPTLPDRTVVSPDGTNDTDETAERVDETLSSRE